MSHPVIMGKTVMSPPCCTVLSLGPAANSKQMLVLVSTTINKSRDSLHVITTADRNLVLHDSLLRMSLYRGLKGMWDNQVPVCCSTLVLGIELLSS